jgi:RNA polymerase sigma-70 factor, ECF subfamily
MSKEVISKETISCFKCGDMAAFDQIYRIYKKKIFLFALSIIKIREDAEGILHDVFLKVWENRKTIDEHLSFESYLFTITYNSTISLMRKKVSEIQYMDYLKSIQNASQQEELNSEVDYILLKEKSDEIIDKLPARQKQVYKLSREDGLSYKEIAKSLNITNNTVETHMERALKTLRTQLGNISSFSVLLFYSLFI